MNRNLYSALAAALIVLSACGGDEEPVDPDLIVSGGAEIPENWISYMDNHDEALEAAKLDGIPLSLYFVSDKSKACRDLTFGALSDSGVIEAASATVFVVIDCTNRFVNEDLTKKYNVKKFPTVIFADPNGKRVNFLKGTDPEVVERQFLTILERYSRSEDDE